MPNSRKATLKGVIDVISVICFGFASHRQTAEKVQNHGMSVVYQGLEANKDFQHRSKSGPWTQSSTSFPSNTPQLSHSEGERLVG